MLFEYQTSGFPKQCIESFSPPPNLSIQSHIKKTYWCVLNNMIPFLPVACTKSLPNTGSNSDFIAVQCLNIFKQNSDFQQNQLQVCVLLITGWGRVWISIILLFGSYLGIISWYSLLNSEHPLSNLTSFLLSCMEMQVS